MTPAISSRCARTASSRWWPADRRHPGFRAGEARLAGLAPSRPRRREAPDEARGQKDQRDGKREIGHVHTDGVVDPPFPRHTAREIVASGRAEPRRAGSSGFVSYYIRTPEDVPGAAALFRVNYERAREFAARRDEHAVGSEKPTSETTTPPAKLALSGVSNGWTWTST